jgi:hypothetical protein
MCLCQSLVTVGISFSSLLLTGKRESLDGEHIPAGRCFPAARVCGQPLSRVGRPERRGRAAMGLATGMNMVEAQLSVQTARTGALSVACR